MIPQRNAIGNIIFWRRIRILTGIAFAAVLFVVGGSSFWVRGVAPTTPIRLPALDAPQPNDRIVVFAPHPDDETLGAGGYLQRAAAVGAHIHVVLMTNGEYGRTGIDNLPELPIERVSGYEDFSMIRQQETSMALGALGVPQSSISFLSYPNHLLERMIQPANWSRNNPVFDARLNTSRIPFPDAMSPRAPYCGEALLKDVETVLLREKPTVVITLHPNDIHPDHWATSAITQYALNELAAQGYPFARTCRTYGYLIHRGTWPRPKAYLPMLPLLPPPSLLHLSDWRQWPLTSQERRLKGEAIGLFETQGGGTSGFMRSFIRTNDLYALLSARTWATTPAVGAKLVINNPVADFPQAQRYPSADIARVVLARKSNELIVTITTRRQANDNTSFFISIAAGGKTASARRLIQYQWQRAQASGTALAGDVLSTVPQQSLRSSVVGRRAILRAPWPLMDSQAKFFLLQVWSGQSKHFADLTAATIVHIESETNPKQ